VPWMKRLVFAVGVTTALGQSPAPLNLGTAATFTILSKAGITNVPPSVITGNIGVLPIAAGAMTGFDLVADGSNTFSTSTQVMDGNVYAASYAAPTAATLTVAIHDMEAAYVDAASRTPPPEHVDRKGGNINDETFAAGVHQWSQGVSFTGRITIYGSASDVFIFKLTQSLLLGSGARVLLGGGAVASNIFWQVAGTIEADTISHLEGIFLVKTSATFKTGATVNGRVFA